MNLKTLSKLTSVVLLLSFGLSAQATFYQCMFTEPFFSLTVTTKGNSITESSYPKSIGHKIISQSMESGVLILNTDKGKKLEIFLNKFGSDGMSDFNFPYEAKFGPYYGGCSSEETIFKNFVVERGASLVNKAGRVYTSHWPGEYGGPSFRTLKELSVTKTRYSLRRKYEDLDGKSCTLKKGTGQFGEGSSFDRWFVTYPYKYKVVNARAARSNNLELNSELLELAPLGEGFCLVEQNGRIFDLDCPSNNSDWYKEVSLAPEGQSSESPSLAEQAFWMYASCKEGHKAWISYDQLERDYRKFMEWVPPQF